MQPRTRPGSALTLLVGILLLCVVALAVIEYVATRGRVLGEVHPSDEELSNAPNGLLGTYLTARQHVLRYALLYAPAAIVLPGLAYWALRRAARGMSEFRERVSGMAFETTRSGLAHPFAGDIGRMQQAFIRVVEGNPTPHEQVVLGIDAASRPVYLTDRARSMHVHVLGQTGSGKTQSVLYPLLFQDIRRGRAAVFLDAKGSMENEDALAAMAAACGRTSGLFVFTLNPGRTTHTYNPVYVPPNGDPRQIAERVFSTFESDLDVQYYKDMARELWVNLVCAIASTGRQATMLDLAAAIADPAIMAHALSLATDKKAARAIDSRYRQLGDRLGMTYTGLLAAVNRYDHPALNTYVPDIILEDIVESGGLCGFSLSANAYKFQARAIGLIVLQHIQQIGALRQMDRSRSQTPLYVYADEFYTFAYEGFIDAVNKLRDANISLLLSHQSLSDLERVSPEYASAVWDNTRNKIVLYQNDAAICERLAASVGTRKNVELTVRRNVDGFLNQASALEASSRQVEEFILHPNELKNLLVGQAYLVQAGIGGGAPAKRWWRRKPAQSAAHVAGVNLALMPTLPAARAMPSMSGAIGEGRGIGLHDLFLQERAPTRSA